MLNLEIGIPYNIMKCSNLSRCNKPSLTHFGNIYICQNCNGIWKKGTKYIKDILIKCCNNQSVNRKYNIPFCNNCFTLCVDKCYL